MKTIDEASEELRASELVLWLKLHTWTAKRLGIGWKSKAHLARMLGAGRVSITNALTALHLKRYIDLEIDPDDEKRVRLRMLERFDARGPLFVKF